ncbi:helicase associated domain-containing protein (plasmid) [Streptomyces sp. NBC_01005]|uniref:helicase associated domain-containing protein n=1 Tax=unclassified Streptomyces TaxID=2593676 RepID=UPI002E345479|nr:helicase associated domain-containing protein [Streptomyces sp. NBC_01362]WSW11372.1 helicase associated domain-containing protein [Streptomyces sp. NBC_01005]WTD00875.1 helicase associated domain-containing protein [Streptomyces sp. NBC_01650]
MVWSEQDAAWADGIAVAKEYAAAHGHFLPPTTAVWEGHPIGVWAKNARAAARRARENEELRAAGRPVPSAAGAMTEARRDELDAIDPGWCPVWDTGWQRCLRLVQIHVQAGRNPPGGCGRRRGPGRKLRTLGLGAAVRVGTTAARAAVAPGEHAQGHAGRGGGAAGEADAGWEVGGQPCGGTGVLRP